MYKVEFEGLTGALKKISIMLGLSFWNILTFPPHGTSDGICQTGFLIFALRLWAHQMISISNHTEHLPHSLHTQKLPFYKPNTIYRSKSSYFALKILIIIIIIMSCRQHGYPWPSLATPPYRSSLLAGPQGYTPYPHKAVVRLGFEFAYYDSIALTITPQEHPHVTRKLRLIYGKWH